MEGLRRLKHGFWIYADCNDNGLLICTWPNGGRPAGPVRYCDEVWTGIKHQVAAHCIMEGLVDQGMRSQTDLRDRDFGERRNPCNEIECGDHCSRAMAGWGVVEAISGLRHDAVTHAFSLFDASGRNGSRLSLITATGWGSLVQNAGPGGYRVEIQAVHGSITVRTVVVDAYNSDNVKVEFDGKPLPSTVEVIGQNLAMTLPAGVAIGAGSSIAVTVADRRRRARCHRDKEKAMRLFLLNLGRADVDKGVVLTPGSGDGVRVVIPIPGYLIETDDGQRLLVDTGMHRKHIADPGATFDGTPFAASLTVVMTPEDDIVHRLAEIGLTVGDIDILVATHFHFDHAGNHGDFEGTRIVAQRVAYDAAKAVGDPLTRDLWDLPHLNYEFVDGDVELVPGVELIETGGHAPGHMSLLVRLPKTGPVLLAIDAISTLENLATDNWGTAADPAAAQRSAHRLAGIAEREGALLITGHDPGQWSSLRLAPACHE